MVLDNLVLVRKTVGTSGAEELVKAAGFEVFPNPASENISLKVNNLKTQEAFDVQVYNARGVLVFQQENARAGLDIEGLAQGVYFLKIRLEKGGICRKIIVQ